MEVKVLSGSLLYQGKAISLKKEEIELPSGKRIYRETVIHHGASATIPVMDNDKIIFIRQYRHPVGEYLLEIPAGTLRLGEDPESCARRELEEETGYIAGELIHLLTIYPSPGYSNEKLHIYLARKLEKSRQNLEADEDISLVFLNLQEALEAIRDRRIVDAKTLVSIFYYSFFVK